MNYLRCKYVVNYNCNQSIISLHKLLKVTCIDCNRIMPPKFVCTDKPLKTAINTRLSDTIIQLSVN